MKARGATLIAGMLLAGPLTAAHLDVILPEVPLTVGDPVPLSLELRLDPDEVGSTPRFPTWGERWGAAEVVDTEKPRKLAAEHGVVWRQRMTVRAFRTGAVALPPVEVAIPFAEETLRLVTPDTLALEIQSVLPAGVQIPEPEGPAGLVPLPWGAAFWWTLGLGGLAILAALGLLMHESDDAPVREGRPELPPLQELEEGLATLSGEDDSLAWHDGASQILRRFLARRLGFHALESTTREVVTHLTESHMPADAVRQTRLVLAQCDQVRYARQPPERTNREVVEAVRQAAAEIERHLAPVEPDRDRDAA